MVIELTHLVTMWLNSFPMENDISSKWSPHELLWCHKFNAKLHCKAQVALQSTFLVHVARFKTNPPSLTWCNPAHMLPSASAPQETYRAHTNFSALRQAGRLLVVTSQCCRCWMMQWCVPQAGAAAAVVAAVPTMTAMPQSATAAAAAAAAGGAWCRISLRWITFWLRSDYYFNLPNSSSASSCNNNNEEQKFFGLLLLFGVFVFFTHTPKDPDWHYFLSDRRNKIKDWFFMTPSRAVMVSCKNHFRKKLKKTQ